MRCPIVPFLIFGAYGMHITHSLSLSDDDDDDDDDDVSLLIPTTADLYPVGHWVNQTGVIVVRYLPAISPTEATSRDDMMRLVRVMMMMIYDDDDDDDILFDRN